MFKLLSFIFFLSSLALPVTVFGMMLFHKCDGGSVIGATIFGAALFIAGLGFTDLARED